MTLVFAVVGLVFIAIIGLLAVGRFGQLNNPERDQAPEPELSEPFDAADVAGLRFSIAARGYRMGQVDSALRELASAISHRDQVIAELRADGRQSAVESATSQSAPVSVESSS